MVLKIRCSIWKSKLMAFCLGYLPFKGGKNVYICLCIYQLFSTSFLVYRFWSSKPFFKWRTAWKAACLGNTSCAWMPLLLFLLLKKAEGEIIVHHYPFKNGTSLECHRSWMKRHKKINKKKKNNLWANGSQPTVYLSQHITVSWLQNKTGNSQN